MHSDVKQQSVNPNKALWEKGDFTRIAESMRESGEALGQILPPLTIHFPVQRITRPPG